MFVQGCCCLAAVTPASLEKLSDCQARPKQIELPSHVVTHSRKTMFYGYPKTSRTTKHVVKDTFLGVWSHRVRNATNYWGRHLKKLFSWIRSRDVVVSWTTLACDVCGWVFSFQRYGHIVHTYILVEGFSCTRRCSSELCQWTAPKPSLLDLPPTPRVEDKPAGCQTL